MCHRCYGNIKLKLSAVPGSSSWLASASDDCSVCVYFLDEAGVCIALLDQSGARGMAYARAIALFMAPLKSSLGFFRVYGAVFECF